MARALAQEPRELFLDEATNDLDVQHHLELLRVVSTLAHTSIVALPDLNHAVMSCKRLLVLEQGCRVADGPTRSFCPLPSWAESSASIEILTTRGTGGDRSCFARRRRTSEFLCASTARRRTRAAARIHSSMFYARLIQAGLQMADGMPAISPKCRSSLHAVPNAFAPAAGFQTAP
ncbi:hypothetical protein [Paracoccus maritimus]|uniref:hypothetical protein n=1 Tax=Paracoccus maritimus TaxID=2933292 RepID=UPI003CE4B31A